MLTLEEVTHMRHSIRYLFILLLFIPVILHAQEGDEETPTETASDTSGGLDIRVIGEPTVEDERVSFDVVIFNNTGAVEGGLDVSNFAIDEQSSDLTVESIAESPIALALVINAGLGVEIPLIQQTLRAYFNTYYNEADEVVLYILDGQATSQSPRVVPVNDLDSIDRAIAQLSAPSNYLNITSTLNMALSQATRWQDEAPDRAVQVMYVAPFLNRVDERDESFIFTANQIPFHVIQVHEARRDATDDMRALAINGNGIYANNENGVLLNDSGQAVGQLVTLYNRIADNRVTYQVSYHPARPSAGERSATLSVSTPNGLTGSTDFIYEGLASPPLIELVSPPSLNMREVGGLSLSEILTISVTFPDEIPRDITNVRVEIYDTTSGGILQSFIDPDPVLRGGEINLSWEFGNYAIAGTQTNIELVIIVSDELGFTTSIRTMGRLSIIAPSPTPTITPIPTETPIPSATPIFGEQASAVVTGSTILFPLLCFILFLGFWVISLQIRNINQRRQYASQPRYMPQPTEEIILTENPVEDLEPEENLVDENAPKIYGRLFVMQGLDEHEIIIDREEFKIGRKAIHGCNFVIDEPFINSEHCLFIVRGKNILLKDLNSKNGTFVNGERLQPNREAMVPIGSEIQITRNISVQLNDPDTELSPSLRRTIAQQDSNQEDGDLQFRPMLQVRYVDDTDNLPDEYTPL